MKNEHDGQHQPDNGLVEKLRKLLRRYFETDVNGDPIPEHDPLTIQRRILLTTSISW